MHTLYFDILTNVGIVLLKLEIELFESEDHTSSF